MDRLFIPHIVASINGEERTVSLLEHDFLRRTVYLCGEINDEMAMSLISQLKYLEYRSKEDITMIIY